MQYVMREFNTEDVYFQHSEHMKWFSQGIYSMGEK